MTIINKPISKNKAIELDMFSKAWKCFISLNLDWTSKKHETDHWGINFDFILFGFRIIEFHLYDMRHCEDDDEE